MDRSRKYQLAGERHGDSAVNEEWNCDKGRWAFKYVTSQNRITSPMVRNAEGELVAVSWPEALAAAAISTLAAESATGRPPGRSEPIAPASSAPRSPARRGIHANFAPVLSASATAAEISPALSDARSPRRITDLAVNAIEESAALSAPGATFTNVALSLSIAIEDLVATDVTASPRFLKFLFRRKKTIGDSSSGSNATRRT